MSGHLALVLYIKTAFFVQPYLLEKIDVSYKDSSGYRIEQWRLHTPICANNHCPDEFSFYDRGILPSTIYENTGLLYNVEQYLELYYNNMIFMENDGEINKYGFFNITVLDDSKYFIFQFRNKPDKIKLVSCYEAPTYKEDMGFNGFKRDWNLKDVAEIHEDGSIVILRDSYNIENNVKVFRQWYSSIVGYELNKKHTVLVNLSQKIRMIWKGGEGIIYRPAHFYVKEWNEENIKIKQEL